MRRQVIVAAVQAILVPALGLFLTGLPRAEEESVDSEIEVVDMTPDEAPKLGVSHLTSGFGALFKGPGHYYTSHEILVETVPEGAFLDLFYVRANFQKRFEQAESPVRVMLPPRAESGKRDALRVRAFAEGYRQKTVTIKANTSEERVVIDLDPLPNELQSFAHQYFGGRTTLVFLTEEPLTFRVQTGGQGASVVLTETGRSAAATAAMDGTSSPILEEVVGQQLGEDLLVKLVFTGATKPGDVDIRSRKSYDAARDLHSISIDLVPTNEKEATVQRALAALEKVRRADVTGCNLAFEKSLRENLDGGALSRALAPSGSFTDPYVRAAMRRLGKVSPGGVVVFTDGTRYDPAVMIELEASLIQAADAKGFLALLRRFVDGMEGPPYREETLRSLLAPELDGEAFSNVVEIARSSEQACLARR